MPRLADASLVGLGGAAGSIARYTVGTWLVARFGAGFPYGTLAVNVAGSFIAGVLFGFGDGRVLSTPARLALLTGFVSGYSTFSAFAMEAITLAQQQGLPLATANVVANLTAGIGVALLGLAIGRAY